jgi:hypothetical protein
MLIEKELSVKIIGYVRFIFYIGGIMFSLWQGYENLRRSNAGRTFNGIKFASSGPCSVMCVLHYFVRCFCSVQPLFLTFPPASTNFMLYFLKEDETTLVIAKLFSLSFVT